jgi:hypothetical protein
MIEHGLGSGKIRLCTFILTFSLSECDNSLHLQRQKDINMLGINSLRTPIQGTFADEIRESVHRVTTGHLNESDKSRMRRSRKVLSRYEAVWA